MTAVGITVSHYSEAECLDCPWRQTRENLQSAFEHLRRNKHKVVARDVSYTYLVPGE